MACLCRIRQTRVNRIFFQLRRSYLQVSPPCLSDYVAQNKIPTSLVRRQIFGVHGRSKGLFDIVRFFAAPVQSKKKEETKTSKGPCLNEQIKAHMVRLVNDEGHEVVPFHVAMERAKSLNQDLVEVDRNAKPIVCKIMDYHRERYQKQLKDKERSKSKADISVRKGASKEVRFTPKIDQKDLQMKADMAKRLMERGYRVKCMVVGKEEEDLGGLIDRLHSLIEEVAYVESGPRVERSQAYVVVRHIKFGPSKKGGKAGAAKSADSASSVGQKDVVSQSRGDPIQHPPNPDSVSESDCDENYAGDSESQLTPEQDRRKWPHSDHTGKTPAPQNLSENRYSRRQEDSTRFMMRPGPDRAQNQMPRLPNPSYSDHTGKTPVPQDLSENRYSRRQEDSTRFMVRPGPDRAQNQMPRLPNPSENRYSRQNSIPNPFTSYGVFSKTQSPSALKGPKPDADSSAAISPQNNRSAGLFNGEGSNAKTFQNQSKFER